MLTAAAAARFAIYFVPAAGSALYRFGAAVLGYDCYTGEAVARRCAGALTEADWAALTIEPRRYGFHATLKAPFRLREEFSQADLAQELRQLAASLANPPRFAPTVDLIAGFVAIVPQDRASPVDQLAADCVTRFDRFRTPMTAEERARKTTAGLSVAQMRNIERWGYPYVLDEFRFHMTLTGRVQQDRRAKVHALLQEMFTEACGFDPIALDRLTLLRQDHPDAPFRVIAQAAANELVPGLTRDRPGRGV